MFLNEFELRMKLEKVRNCAIMFNVLVRIRFNMLVNYELFNF